VREIFAGSRILGQGNPAITRHPQSEAQCEERRREAGVPDADPGFERICGAPYMAPLYDPAVRHRTRAGPRGGDRPHGRAQRAPRDAALPSDVWLLILPFALALLALEEGRKWIARRLSRGPAAPGTVW
jgi:hypothetical protein